MPTLASQGLPGFEQSSKVGVYAPAKTPAGVINRLNQEFVQVLNRPDIREKFHEMGLEPASSTPQEFAAIMTSEMARVGKLIKDAGIRADE
jgi:tripartite-type tricarboxylate transporter receptor subunit TctC